MAVRYISARQESTAIAMQVVDYNRLSYLRPKKAAAVTGEGVESSKFTESIVEEAALEWLEAKGWTILHGPEIAAGMPTAERDDPNFRDVVLERRLRQSLEGLNPALSSDAIEAALRKLTIVDGPSLLERNRAAWRMLVDGVGVEITRPDGSPGGYPVQVVDFDNPDNNDWVGYRATPQHPALKGEPCSAPPTNPAGPRQRYFSAGPRSLQPAPRRNAS